MNPRAAPMLILVRANLWRVRIGGRLAGTIERWPANPAKRRRESWIAGGTDGHHQLHATKAAAIAQVAAALDAADRAAASAAADAAAIGGQP